MTPLTDQEVLAAAADLVAAFAATDTERYFACFAPDADFVFHTEPDRLHSRADYEHRWASWLAEGWRVEACVSTVQRVRLLPGAAVFVHDVATTVLVGGQQERTRERETIIFVRDPAGHPVAVHEHLSPIARQPEGEERS